MKNQDRADIVSVFIVIALLLLCWLFFGGCATVVSTPPRGDIEEANLVQELYFDLKADGVIDYQWGATPDTQRERLEAKARKLLENTDGQ
jgi:hypothetical protein